MSRSHLNLLAVLLCALSPAAQANLLTNGSFEVGPVPGTFVNLTGGSTAITGWTVTGTTIDYVGSLWEASDGSRSLDLDGSIGWPHTNGGVAQSFATMPGMAYVVSFDLAGNPYNTPTIKPMRVAAAGQSQDFTFDSTGRSVVNMGWLAQSWSFTAVAAMTTLEFRSLTQAPQIGWGAALDNVSVSVVPEPAGWALMLAGMALLGGLSRRSVRLAARAADDATSLQRHGPTVSAARNPGASS